MAKIGINIATGSIQQEEMIVGIDLGTTNSLVAVIHPGSKKPVVLKEFDGNALVPSVIHFGEARALRAHQMFHSVVLLPWHICVSGWHCTGFCTYHVGTHPRVVVVLAVEDDILC